MIAMKLHFQKEDERYQNEFEQRKKKKQTRKKEENENEIEKLTDLDEY